MTQTQQQIIIDLTKEFEIINKQTPIKGRLIDISSILDEVHQDDITREEVRINNRAYSDLLHNMVDEHVKMLNEDLKELGLLAMSFKDSHSNKSTSWGIRITCSRHEVNIRYRINSKSVRLTNKQDIQSYQGFKCVTAYLESNNWENSYDTLEELVASKHFSDKIRFMYESTLKTK